MAHNDGSMRPPGAMSLTGNLASGCAGSDAANVDGTRGHIDIYRTFEWANALDKDDIEEVKAKFEAYFAPRRNVTYESYKFMKRI